MTTPHPFPRVLAEEFSRVGVIFRVLFRQVGGAVAVLLLDAPEHAEARKRNKKPVRLETARDIHTHTTYNIQHTEAFLLTTYLGQY